MSNYWISDVKEQAGKGTIYAVTVENASVKMVLTNAVNGWQVLLKNEGLMVESNGGLHTKPVKRRCMKTFIVLINLLIQAQYLLPCIYPSI